jgi:hypothetical protein
MPPAVFPAAHVSDRLLFKAWLHCVERILSKPRAKKNFFLYQYFN